MVGAISWFGHSARAFLAYGDGLRIMRVVILIGGVTAEPAASTAAASGESSHPALLAILLAFPAAMALATEVEAPSTAIAQLGQLADEGRKRFGLLALLATLVIVAPSL